jgi:glycosyltransferase involved in cell wall biosynthesis
MRESAPRLCMLVHGPYPIGEPRVAREVRVALEAGFEVDVVAMRRPGEPAQEWVEGAHVVRLPLSHRRGSGFLAALGEYLGFAALASLHLGRAVLRGPRGRFAVVQVHSPPDFLVVAALLPKLLGARVILDLHDLSSDMFAMRFGASRWSVLAERLVAALERWSIRLADAVLTVHEPYREELIRRGAPAEKIAVVMNSLDETLLPLPRETSAPGFRVVYHGTVTPPYGVEVLVRAAAEIAAEVPDLRLEIYGEGDSLPAVKAAAHRLGLDDRLVLSGRYLPQREVLERIQGASVGVIPNLPTRLNRYALSSKLFEYVAMGIPVVCSDLPTLRAHFDGDEALFFAAGDARSLAGALRAVAADPEGAARRARAARRRYERYRWGIQARRYTGLLRSLT